jgi:archaellin
VIGEDGKGAGKSIDTLSFWVENTAGGSPVDMTNMIMTFKSGDETYTIWPAGADRKIGAGEEKAGDLDKRWKAIYRPGKEPGTLKDEEWGVFKISPGPAGDGDNLLELGEKMQIGVKLGGKNKGALPNQDFVLELKPVGGSGGGVVYPIHLKAPASIDPVNELH